MLDEIAPKLLTPLSRPSLADHHEVYPPEQPRHCSSIPAELPSADPGEQAHVIPRSLIVSL